MQEVDAAFDGMIAANEAPVRMMLAQSLELSVRADVAKDVPGRQNRRAPLIEAAREDRVAWVAYPKAGQLDTDLNRDILWQHLLRHNIQGVRQVALDSVWSAMRFRPEK